MDILNQRVLILNFPKTHADFGQTDLKQNIYFQNISKMKSKGKESKFREVAFSVEKPFKGKFLMCSTAQISIGLNLHSAKYPRFLMGSFFFYLNFLFPG